VAPQSVTPESWLPKSVTPESVTSRVGGSRVGGSRVCGWVPVCRRIRAGRGGVVEVGAARGTLLTESYVHN